MACNHSFIALLYKRDFKYFTGVKRETKILCLQKLAQQAPKLVSQNIISLLNCPV
jgi:hypothetical protein